MCESPHRAVDQEVDGAVDGQEEVVDAEKYIRIILVYGLATIEANSFTMFFWSKTIGFFTVFLFWQPLGTMVFQWFSFTCVLT